MNRDDLLDSRIAEIDLEAWMAQHEAFYNTDLITRRLRLQKRCGVTYDEGGEG